MAFTLGTDRRRVRPAINITPLVDVVLVLLIIFMVVTPLLTKQFWAHVPLKEDANSPPPPSDGPPPIVLSLLKDGRIEINRDPVTQQELPGRLARVLAGARDHTLFFTADDDVPFGRTMEIMDLARSGGALTIAVITDEPLR
ncbi:MAG: biopolymer transporter ExbD [Myxococcales bacterium]|nr:MAG: biopolymer transporter ExbD [Myxococcales bacterium]